LKNIDYVSVVEIDKVVSLLSENTGAVIMAGGSDIVQQIKDHMTTRPIDLIIDIKRIPELSSITVDDDCITIGSNVTVTQIINNQDISARVPLLEQTARSIAMTQIRNIATIGGNILQDVRCWYYRYPDSMGQKFMCLRRGGNFCPARQGDNRYHSIFYDKAAKGCIAVNPSDMLSTLVLLDATFQTNKRNIKAINFYPGKLGHTEILIKIRIPTDLNNKILYYEKIRTRGSIDFSIVSLAAKLYFEGSVLKTARLVFGGVAIRPYENENLNHVIIDMSKGGCQDYLQTRIKKESRTTEMNEYKVMMMKALMHNALTKSGGLKELPH